MPDPQIKQFAQQLEALRESRLQQKIGVFLPTCQRPDLARAAVLQLMAQSQAPDLVCVHQNGVGDSYQWAVADLQPPATKVAWLHTQSALPQLQWYAIPLQYLLEHGCTHFFWADHDDLYFRQHVETGMARLAEADIALSSHCGLLFTRDTDYRFNPDVQFTSHAPGGMNASLCFTRPVAKRFLADLQAAAPGENVSNVFARVTMPAFRVHVDDRSTTVYHAHPGAVTSHEWLGRAFGDDAPRPG